MAVNAAGDVIDPASGAVIAGPRLPEGGFARTSEWLRERPAEIGIGGSTTLAVVATDAELTKVEATKVARMAHDGLARAIDPVHTMLDGDTVFALATGAAGTAADVTAVGAAAATVLARAVLAAVRDGHVAGRHPGRSRPGRRRLARRAGAGGLVSGAPPGCSCGGGPREPYRPPGGTLLYLSRDDLESLGVTMLEVVDAVDAGCAAKGRGEVVMPPKLSLHGEGDAYSQVMAATLPGDGGLGAKWVTLFPQNAARGLPITNGLVVLSDPETGLPSAVMDAATITAWRTGASVGVAARYLARPDAARAGVLGCGVQARAAVRALAAVLPGLREVSCHDAVPAAAEAFLAELRPELPDVDLRVVADAGGGGVRRRRGRHRDHDDGGHPAAARPRAAGARGAGGGPRLRRRLESGGHGGVRPVLLRRRRDGAGDAGGRRASRRHARQDRRGPRRAGRRPRRRPRDRRTSACSASISAWRSRTS